MDHNQGGKEFLLREEVPDLQLQWIPTGEVSWHTETISEEKTIRLPVRRKELVIKRKYLDRDGAGTEPRVETTRYVLREERLDYQVRSFDIQTVRIDKLLVQGSQPAKVTLKKEILAIKRDAGITLQIVDG